MSSSHRFSATRAGMLVSAAALILALVGVPDPASASILAPEPSAASGRSAPQAGDGGSRIVTVDGWVWPIAGRRVIVRGFEAPASRYSAGHRGIDLAAATGTAAVSPTAGTVHFVGVVVDRPTITVATPDGVLVSMEPVGSELRAGATVAKGAQLGAASTGGHCSGGCVHLGVRINGQYVSPLRFFGGVQRAVLLPMR